MEKRKWLCSNLWRPAAWIVPCVRPTRAKGLPAMAAVMAAKEKPVRTVPSRNAKTRKPFALNVQNIPVTGWRRWTNGIEQNTTWVCWKILRSFRKRALTNLSGNRMSDTDAAGAGSCGQCIRTTASIARRWIRHAVKQVMPEKASSKSQGCLCRVWCKI